MFLRTRTASRSRAACLGVLLATTLTALTGPAVSATPTVDPVAGARQAATTDLTIASFNVLGSSHTRGSSRYASGVARTAGVVKLLQQHHVEVVGLQEMQADQMRSFQSRTHDTYDVYPGLGGGREIDGENSLAWDRTSWQAVEKRTFEIPYFDGNRRAMPLVKLRNLRTGMTAWFANVHNPATNRAHPGQDGWRRKAIAAEARLVRRLDGTGVPVFLTGDMNEREQAFCPLTGQAPLQAARGGSHQGGVCRAGNPRYVDWVFGSRKLTFDGYVEDRGALDKRTSDHPVVVGQAHIDPLEYRAAVQPVPAG